MKSPPPLADRQSRKMKKRVHKAPTLKEVVTEKSISASIQAAVLVASTWFAGRNLKKNVESNTYLHSYAVLNGTSEFIVFV